MTPEAPVVRVAAPTERPNPASVDLDLLPTREVLRVINEADRTVPDAVARVLDPVAEAVELAVAAIRGGGRVHYFGAGTSGRLAVLDAAELPPTYNAPADWFHAHLAGGREALWQAAAEVEDDHEAGAREAAVSVQAGDVVLGLAASGRTPYVLGALRAAAARGARTVLISGDPQAVAATDADVFVGCDTGPEVVAGSTRMKAATAQKLILNAFSTAVMVRLGRVYSHFMVAMVATNAKLRGRTLTILTEATGFSEPVCREALSAAGGDVKAALVSLLGRTGAGAAREALADADGDVRAALARLASR